jgi:hypothetical protein
MQFHLRRNAIFFNSMLYICDGGLLVTDLESDEYMDWSWLLGDLGFSDAQKICRNSIVHISPILDVQQNYNLLDSLLIQLCIISNLSNSTNCIEHDHASCEVFVKTIIDGLEITNTCACQCHNSSYELAKKMFGAIKQNEQQLQYRRSSFVNPLYNRFEVPQARYIYLHEWSSIALNYQHIVRSCSRLLISETI